MQIRCRPKVAESSTGKECYGERIGVTADSIVG